MKFKRYLNEEISDEVIDSIRKDCQPFLKYKNFLFRGMSGKGKEAFIKERRKDRQPLHTDEVVNKIIDNIFLKVWGWRARSEGVFATNGFDVSFYGQRHAIFPIGNFTYLWSELFTDALVLDKSNCLYFRKETRLRLFSHSGQENGKDKYFIRVGNIKDYTEDLEIYIKKYYTNKNIKKFFKSKDFPEIMLNVDSYWAVPFGSNISRGPEIEELKEDMAERLWG
jgi:hypothetical protein